MQDINKHNYSYGAPYKYTLMCCKNLGFSSPDALGRHICQGCKNLDFWKCFRCILFYSIYGNRQGSRTNCKIIDTVRRTNSINQEY